MTLHLKIVRINVIFLPYGQTVDKLFSVQNHKNSGYNTTTADQNVKIHTLNVGMLSGTGCEAMTAAVSLVTIKHMTEFIKVCITGKCIKTPQSTLSTMPDVTRMTTD